MMKYRNVLSRKIYVGDFLYIIAWTLFLLSLLLQTTVLTQDNNSLLMLLKALRYGAYGLCCLKIYMYARFTRKHVLCFFALCCGFFSSFVNTNNLTMVLYLPILLAAIGVDDNKLIKTTVIVQGMVLTVVILLSQLSIIEDYIFEPFGRQRHGLGFTWTTIAPVIFFYFSLGIIYIHRNLLKLSTISILEIFNVFFYVLTDTKMTFFLLTIFLLFIYIQSINKNRFKYLSKFKYIYVVFPFLMLFLSIALVLCYNQSSQLWVKLDALLSHRLRLGRDAFYAYGIELFGKNIEWIGFNISNYTSTEIAANYNYVDSSYLQLSINFGLIFVTAVLLLYSYAIFKAVRYKDYYLVMILICILVLSLTEPRLMNFAFNPFPLMAFSGKGKETRSVRLKVEYINNTDTIIDASC